MIFSRSFLVSNGHYGPARQNDRKCDGEHLDVHTDTGRRSFKDD
jgi:hypothetical protein